MHLVIGIISAIVIFAILVVVHEGGHFCVAKLVGVKVNEFSIGMGPLLFNRKKGETQYSVRAFPVGGYVAMEGESEDSQDERAFNNKPAWARALVLAAGPFMNFLLAVVVIGALITYMGTSIRPVLDTVDADSPAWEAGLEAGDTITGVNDLTSENGAEISAAIRKASGEAGSVDITYIDKSTGETIQKTVEFQENEDGTKTMGIVFSRGHNFLIGMKYGVLESVEMEKEMITVLGEMFTGRGSADDVVGPVGIVTVVDKTAQSGILNLIYLLALLSLNLGLVNIIPFPALDGGRLLFLVIRAVTGKVITDKMENMVHYVGLVVLLSLMLMITLKDINTFIIH